MGQGGGRACVEERRRDGHLASDAQRRTRRLGKNWRVLDKKKIEVLGSPAESSFILGSGSELKELVIGSLQDAL